MAHGKQNRYRIPSQEKTGTEYRVKKKDTRIWFTVNRIGARGDIILTVKRIGARGDIIPSRKKKKKKHNIGHVK
jgi:hypothetical protein